MNSLIDACADQKPEPFFFAVGLYVYISSDSVYEVSVPKLHSGASVEKDAVRPRNAEEQQRLKELDSYGHYKLACEEVR